MPGAMTNDPLQDDSLQDDAAHEGGSALAAEVEVLKAELEHLRADSLRERADQVLQKGYVLNERLLRPALVMVVRD